MNQKFYTLIKLPIQEIIAQDSNVTLDRDTEIERNYLIKQSDSLLFDQIERLRGRPSSHISEIILMAAGKNPKQEEKLRHILTHGFTYNGKHYRRFGKSASQGKAGITAFIWEEMYSTLYQISQMDIPVDNCVISKYEAQRCLIFSSCTLVKKYMPRIVIIGEYQKTLFHQLIKYVKEQERTFTDPQTGETRTYRAKEIKEGYRDIPLSPFDGCGCHEKEFMAEAAKALDLDYLPIGCQVRMPFLKGYSVYVPFRAILKEWGYTAITDIYGQSHPIDEIDCIWNTSMFKGHKLFFSACGKDAWTAYKRTFRKYQFKLGISKYSHPVSRLNKKTRMNFQYLQCLDLWNPDYIAAFENREPGTYDILSPDHEGKIIQLAKYTTRLWEQIIQGSPFYTCKFLGITDTEDYEPDSRFLEAVLINPDMLKDPAVKQFLYRKLKKSIQEAKVGKIYADGFYHTIVGDMIGYLEYAAGLEPRGCLNAGEFYCATLKPGECISFLSPLVCPSEVNKINLVTNHITEQYFSCFKNQDVAMLNMYDLSLPQQGGADCDGDIVFLCNHPVIIASKIEKPIIIDMDDKTLAASKPYTQENIVEYEVMTRDSRIGEITNAATSIENRYTRDEERRQKYSDYASLLRLYQGHEIDFLKTGTRWHLSNALQKHLQQLPYFLLFHYPKKMETYQKLKEKGYPLNAYHSPSPMNELCDYICAWEKKHILWNNNTDNLCRSRELILNPDYDYSDLRIQRIVRHTINDYANEIRSLLEQNQDKSSAELNSFHRDALIQKYQKQLTEQISLPEEHLANYVISVSYRNLSISKAFAWAAYGSVILQNLCRHTPGQTRLAIKEVPRPTEDSYEYLGKYYELTKTDTKE